MTKRKTVFVFTKRQAEQLVEMFGDGPDSYEIEIGVGMVNRELRAWLVEYPDEGYMWLDGAADDDPGPTLPLFGNDEEAKP